MVDIVSNIGEQLASSVEQLECWTVVRRNLVLEPGATGCWFCAGSATGLKL